MLILGLDLATTTGYAVKFNDGQFISGVVSFKPKRGDSPGMIFLRFGAWLQTIYEEMKKEDGENLSLLVAYEQPHHRGGRSTEVLVGLVAKTQEFCAANGFEHTAVHSATLKKFATGGGRSNKEQMVRTATEKFGKTPQDDNEADALWLMSWASEEVGEPLATLRV